MTTDDERGGGLAGLFDRINDLFDLIPDWLILLALRVGIAMVFLKSGLTKVESWSSLGVTDQTVFLFEHEYAVPLLPPEIAAWLAAFAERLCGFLIIIGFATRLNALALFGMTAVIQIFVYPDKWDLHLLWAGALLVLIRSGAGMVSIDHAIARGFGRG